MVANVETANQPIVGTVTSLAGTVKAIGIDGSERILQAGDQVHADEMIVTGVSASVNINFNDSSSLDLASDARVALDSDVYGATSTEDASTSVEAVQRSITEGQDPTATLPAPGAGSTDSEGGHDFIRVDNFIRTNLIEHRVNLIEQRVNPESGFETEELSFASERSEPEEELLIAEPRDEEIREPELESEPPVISVTALTSSVHGSGTVVEGNPGDNTTFEFEISLDKAPTQTVTVEYSLNASGALPYHDYDGMSGAGITGTITFNPGDELSQTLEVDILEDTTSEPRHGGKENFYLDLHSAVNAEIADGSVSTQATIIDDDVVISVTALTSSYYGTGTVIEGDPGDDTTFEFKISLDKAPTQTVTVEYSLNASGAFPGHDYDGMPKLDEDGNVVLDSEGKIVREPLQGTITFNPGDELSQILEVDIMEDPTYEPRHGGKENFYLDLHSAVNAEIADGSISTNAIIIDDEPVIIYGGSGDDTLTGGAGLDTLTGGEGSDTLTGSAGSDTFVWIAGDEGTEATPAIDVITDFTQGLGGDVIDLSDLLPAGASSDLESYLDFALVDGNTEIQIDLDGGGASTATQTIMLEGIDLVASNSPTQIITQLVDNGNLIV